MATMSHKSPTTMIVAGVAGLVVVAALTPQLVALADALLPLIVIGAVAIAGLRLLFFHTRKW
jgi:hypothetical protein